MTTPHYDRETLIDYLHGALEPDADAAVFAHLESCAACDALHADEAGLAPCGAATGPFRSSTP